MRVGRYIYPLREQVDWILSTLEIYGVENKWMDRLFLVEAAEIMATTDLA